jgi:hypothetical protein
VFDKTKEKPIRHMTFINSGVYKLSLPFFLGQLTPINENEEYTVYHFPVEVYIQNDEDLAKGILARFVIHPSKLRPAGDKYEDLATILRRAYFTAILMTAPPEGIKWIEYRDADNIGGREGEIREIKLEWDAKTESYRYVNCTILNSIFD